MVPQVRMLLLEQTVFASWYTSVASKEKATCKESDSEDEREIWEEYFSTVVTTV